MPCTPNEITLNPVITPPIPVEGFGIPFSPVQTPSPESDLPESLIEDLLALSNQFGALFPSGLFKANVDFSMKNVLDFVANILTQVAPFLSFYKFILAALNLFTCIIEVLCAIPNPFAVARKLKKLFSECLPPFINLFPWVALISMIIAFLLLILALIEYIIVTLNNIIDTILKNLEVVSNSLQLQDAQSTLAAAQKIASLVCFIQNILAILVAIGAIIAIIENLASVAGITICSDDDNEGCCTPNLCPPFIKNNPDGILVTTGRLVYYQQINTNTNYVFSGLNIPGIENLIQLSPLRNESWQLIDISSLENQSYPIKSIIIPIEDNIFYPESLTFDSNSPLKKVPYTVDLRFSWDPSHIHAEDILGERYFRIKNCIVTRKPRIGLFTYNNNIDLTYSGGTFDLTGGLVFEDDGVTPYIIDGNQLTLNNFIHLGVSLGNLPLQDDALVFDEVEFTWKPNQPALAGYNLITVGCIQEVSVEKSVQNAIIIAQGIQPIIDRIKPKPPATGLLPDVGLAQQCLSDALEKLRKDVSPEGVALFKATAQDCLNNLKDQTLSTLQAAGVGAVSQFNSLISLTPDIQFTTRNIIVSVILKDANNTILTENFPAEVIKDMEEKLEAIITFGEITKFTHDGQHTFTAQLNSKFAGSGMLKVKFDNQILSKVITATNTTNSSIEEQILTYNFIQNQDVHTERRGREDVIEFIKE